MSIAWAQEPHERALWDDLLQRHPAGSAYLLSWYLDHQRAFRSMVEIVIDIESGRAVAGAVLYFLKLPAAHTICIVPSGPIAESGYEKRIPELIASISDRARKRGAILLQYEAFEAEMRDLIRDQYSPRRMSDVPVWRLYHPTLWRELRVDLCGKNPDSLLAGFSATMRNRVRYAIKNGITVIEARSDDELRTIYDLWVEGSRRKSYTIRPLDSFLSLVRDMYRHDAGTVLAANVEGRPAAFVHSVFHGSGSIYLSGAHDPNLLSGNVNPLLQYSVMCQALERKIPWYSLAGPGTLGIRQYKMGFHPRLIDNMRFVSVSLRSIRLSMVRPLISRSNLIQHAKRIASKRM